MQVREIRGAGIFFDAGALGGDLFEVVFIVDVRARLESRWTMDAYCTYVCIPAHSNDSLVHPPTHPCTQASSPEAVQGAIEDTASGIGLRIYGGHILLAAGTVNMVNCHIWDNIVLVQLTDALAFGGDILVSFDCTKSDAIENE
jgi:hypothetical protein